MKYIKFINKNREKTLEDLFRFLSIPSISAQKEHKKDIEKVASWLQETLKNLGFGAKIFPTPGHPVVYAELLKAKGKPTILIYGHYDVQSPDPLDEWNSNPFKPEVRSNNVYARGATDDKGQLFTWITACRALLKENKRLPVNIKFLIEGEEEVGSENLDKFIEQNKSLLNADVCAISDSHCLSKDMPVITYGLKGLTYMEVELKTLAKDVHSGLYGGNVLNPANVLSQIIAKLKDERHKILIPGFYDDVRKLSSAEKKELSKFPFTERQIKEETAAKVIVGEREFSTQERAGARPTLDVNGIWGGYQKEGPKTIIPARAGAKISMRLVPHQNPFDIAKKFENYIKSIAPEGVDLSIKTLSTCEPILMDIKSKFFKTAEHAYEKTFGRKPLHELSGGSIPVTATLKKSLGMDSILMGYGLPDDGLHSPNEKLSLEMFEKGVSTNIEFLKSI